MKKCILATLLLTASTFTLADGFTGNTAQTGVSGFNGPSNTAAKTMNVKQAKTMADDSYVTLRGKIVQHIKGDKYLFQDASDNIVVEIDDELWYGLTVTPNDTVEIIGEIDKDTPWGKVDIDVEHIKKI